MQPFIHDDFLLSTDTARKLYHKYAAPEPIIDYHCHISPKDIAENRQFKNLTEIWLEGDHYKWRAMRANGVDEKYCTGKADPLHKFMAWSATVPQTLRNPLYHWTHLELKRYFDIEQLLNQESAKAIWDKASSLLATEEYRTHGILKRMNVKIVCTTDDPIDDLRYHRQLAANPMPHASMLPAFRPDKALNVHLPDAFNEWVSQLGIAANIDINSFPKFVDAITQRHQYFHENGCRTSDHGLSYCYSTFCSEQEAAGIFEKARAGKAATPDEQSKFASFMMLLFGQLNHQKGWVMQLHVGARRNNNTRMMKQIGPDTGFDSIADWPQVDAMAMFLDRLDSEDMLPRTIVYNLNPADNYAFATMIGNFQDGKVAGKVQLGSGWWFLDQKEGMQWQMNALSSLGLLSRFVGMLTDSRSFMSYPRHEYFRRVLCNLFGTDMENGELPADEELVGGVIRNICFNNAKNYFGFEMPETRKQSAGR